MPVSPIAEAPRTPRRRYRGRFLVVYGILGLLLGAAIVGLVVLVSRPGHHAGAAWSVWKPGKGDVTEVTRQIAQHVGGEYRFAQDDKAIVAVHALPAVVTSSSAGGGYVPIAEVELHGQATQGGVVSYPAGTTWQYVLCGDGQECSIAAGRPSVQRAAVLRREAAELALYTFKYVPDVDAVVTLMPPKAPVTAATREFLVYLRRSDVKSALSRPLRQSVPPTPPIVARPKMPDAPIDRVVGSKVFSWQLNSLQNGAAVMILNPVS